MAKPDAWIPFYVADYLADTSRLSTEQHGAYFLLILDYWRTGAPPDDNAVLSRITGLSLAAWKKHRATIAAFFQIKDGQWRHKRIDAELEAAVKNAERRAAQASKAATTRWGNAEKGSQSSADSNARSTHGAVPGDVLDQCPSSSSSPVTTETDITTQSLSDTARPTRSQDRRGGELNGLGLQEPNPDEKPFVQIIQAFDRERVLAYGAEQGRAWASQNDSTDAKRFLAAGADLDLCREVFRAACQQLKAGGEQPPGTLRFFDQRIANALASRSRPLPTGTARQAGFDPVAHLTEKGMLS